MSLRVVTGPMFAGKSSWILRQQSRSKSLGLEGLIIKPEVPSRYIAETDQTVTTHDEQTTSCISWPMDVSLGKIKIDWSLKEQAFVIVDEAQFCTGLKDLEDLIVPLGIHLILVGLLADADKRPFLTVRGTAEFLESLCRADHIETLHALCVHCKDGTPGPFTLRKRKEGIPSTSETQVLVGTSDIQEAVCRKHFA